MSVPSNKEVLLRAGSVLGSEFCERLAYYSITANLVLFFTNALGLDNSSANTLVLAWTGTCYVTPLLGGYVADTWLGRFKTIITFMVIYIIGMFGLAGGSVQVIAESFSYLSIIALFVIALGTGGIKSSVVTFGADQFSDLDKEQGEKYKQSFFNWFYFSVNIGSFVSFTAVAYIQQEVDFTIGLLIPACIMTVSLIIFIIGGRWYVKVPNSGSVLVRGLRIVFYSLGSKLKCQPNDGSHFLDRAKTAREEETGGLRFDPTDIDNMKSLGRLLPIFACYITFWMIYAQQSSLIFTQGLYLDLSLGNFMLPVSSLHIFNTLPILVLIPILDRVIYPLLRKKGINFSTLKRIGTGYFLAILAMVYTAGLEYFRLQMVANGDTVIQTVRGSDYLAASLTVLAQIPAFILIGAGETFASVAGLEFAYNEAPPQMRSMIQALYLIHNALGSYFGSFLVLVVNLISAPHQWIGKDVNKSHLDYYFLLLAGIGLLNLICFIFVAKNVKEKPKGELEDSLAHGKDIQQGGPSSSSSVASRPPPNEETRLIKLEDDA